MTEKTVSKYLHNLEKHFANDNPILIKAAKLFHELDQIEFDLGLLEGEQTTASKNTWWPIISLVGGNSTARSRFINAYLGSEQLVSGIQTSNHKFSVLLHNNQTTTATLPGTALDVDHRYPFYKISHKIEQQQKGEGNRINSYLEIKTINNERSKGKLFIDVPNINATQTNSVNSMLTNHVILNSDLVLVFVDVFETATSMLDELIEYIKLYQDTNKFIYLVSDSSDISNVVKNSETISTWQRKLSDIGLDTGQFIILAQQQNQLDFSEIEQRITNVGHDRTYRVLDSLEKSIREVDGLIIPEIKTAIAIWKDRVNMSSLIIIGFITFLAILAELEAGILDFLFDPIIGPIIIAVLVGVMVPIHLILSKLQAKLIINRLNARQKELGLLENLANQFEKNLTISRMLLPISDPVGWNKKTKARLSLLSEKTKELVQSFNDDFGSYDGISLWSFLDSSK